MADTNAMIIPKEIVDNEPGPGGQPLDTVDTNRGPKPGERMIGTGPFFWGDLKFGIEYKRGARTRSGSAGESLTSGGLTWTGTRPPAAA